MFGIDISHWQGDYDFLGAKKEGVEFVILKAGGSENGRYTDKKFESNYARAKAQGLPVGAYYFGGDMSVSEAVKSADAFIQLLKGKQFEMPVSYDVEAKMLSLDKKTLTDVVVAFCDRVEKAGYYVNVYASVSTFQYNLDMDRIKRFALWGASYSATARPSTILGELPMWQFGGEKNSIRSNKVCGVVTDQNYCYVDYPSVIKKAGLNGFPKSSAGATATRFNDGDVVKLKSGATYYDGSHIPTWVTKATLYYRGKNENGAKISINKTGAITGVVKEDMLTR